MALIMVMGLSLLVYSLAEKKLRGVLANRELTVKDQKKRPTSRPTIRRVFKKALCNARYNIDYSYILSCKIFPLDI
jgi:transposase